MRELMDLLPHNLFSDDSDLESEEEAAPSPSAIYGTSSNANGGISPTNSYGSEHSSTVERLGIGIFDDYILWKNINLIRSSPAHSNSTNSLDIFGSPPSDGYGLHVPVCRPSQNLNFTCICCVETSTFRCKECNEFMCNNCYNNIHNGSPYEGHQPILLTKPLGSSAPEYATISGCTPKISPNFAHICDIHNKAFLYVCESCNKLLCYTCTLYEHKEHNYLLIEHFTATAQERIDAALHSSRMSTKYIKDSIDRTLEFMRHNEINYTELNENIHKVYPPVITAIQQRERYLLDQVEKLRQRKVTILNEQMNSLKSKLAGISETSETLLGLSMQVIHMNEMDFVMHFLKEQPNMEQIAAMYEHLQPKEDVYTFSPPELGFMKDLANQGAIMSVNENTTEPHIPPFEHVNDNSKIVALPLTTPPPPLPQRSACKIAKNKVWEQSVLRNGASHIGDIPAIPGCIEHVTARRTQIPSLSFGMGGCNSAKLSRPWGLCVDKLGMILVSDRRNNRVQIFYANGLLKLAFGCKGNGDGEFNLPTGICVDKDNRIIVVDKDNHRVQIFTSNGRFLTKFGYQGKAHGQFQYPWDVAVNSRRQIVVTDSRNHRVQQFDAEGRFILQIVFQKYAMPRGVCYTPTGNIIVTDFENHCLYLINTDNNEILAIEGHEGTGLREFNRPSGICCDDDGRIIVADSKNQRVSVYSASMEFLWNIEIRPSLNPFMPQHIDEQDRTCDVAVMPDGRIVLLIEPTPDFKDGTDPSKRFVHAF